MEFSAVGEEGYSLHGGGLGLYGETLPKQELVLKFGHCLRVNNVFNSCVFTYIFHCRMVTLQTVVSGMGYMSLQMQIYFVR